MLKPAKLRDFARFLGALVKKVPSFETQKYLRNSLLGSEAFSFYDELLQIAGSLPNAIGMVVIIFALLQYWEVRPEMKAEPFDPRKLPQLEGDQPIQRGEHVFGIIMEVIVLTFLTQFAAGGGFATDGLFPNPVIHRYFVWIVLSMVAGIVLDIWLLWKGRWEATTRFAKIGVGVVSMAILIVLLREHSEFLSEFGINGFLDGLNQFSEINAYSNPFIGMIAFRIGLTIAFIITAIETLVQFYRLLRVVLKGNEVKSLGIVGTR